MQEIISITDKIKEIKSKLIQEKYEEKLISYEELQQLQKKYIPEIEEKVFTQEVLELTYFNYNSMKYRNQRGKILRKKITLDEERVEEIKKALIENGYTGKYIDYAELQQLHQKYLPEITETLFAQKILGINARNYKIIKNKETRSKILKQEIILDKEKIEKMKNMVIEKGYEEKYIDYGELQQLLKSNMPGLDEKIFAQEVLGISYHGYNYLQEDNKNLAQIKDNIIKTLSHFIKNVNLKDPRFYTKEEIKRICESNNITIDDFIKYVLLNFNNHKSHTSISDYKDILDKKNGLWIGKTPLSEEFAKKHIDEIYINAKMATYKYRAIYEYDTHACEDYIQDLVLFVIQNCGDIEKNYGDNVDFFYKITYNKMKYCLLSKIFTDKKIKFRSADITKRYTKNEKEYEYLSDNEADVEEAVELKLAYEDNIHIEESNFDIDDNLGKKSIDRLKELVAEGYGKRVALATVQEEFNLDKQTLIKIMTDYINKDKDTMDER